MSAYRAKIIDKIDEAKDTLSVRMGKPSGFDYIAGQHSVIKIDSPDIRPQDKAHTFSFSSSPTEDFLQITMRLSDSPFKQFMRSSEIGTELQVFESVGGFVLPEDRDRPVVMIAGGIGIAPFRSMLKSFIDKGEEREVTLLHSNPSFERIPFRQELYDWDSELSKFRVIHTLPESRDDERIKEHRQINAEFIKDHTQNLTGPIFYVCGPPSMVEDIAQILTQELGVKEGSIKDEKFIGY